MNCSYLIDFVRERDRMCDYYCSQYICGCDKCPFGDMTLPHHCKVLGTVDQKMIDLLQQWSDNHQEN